MNKRTIAMKVLLYNIKANRVRNYNILDPLLDDRKQLKIEREKLLLFIIDSFPNANIDLVVTDFENNKYVGFDLLQIEEGLEFKPIRRREDEVGNI